MTREELIKIRDAETWTEVQEEIDKLFDEYEDEVLADGWDSVKEFFDFGNWEIFVENVIDRELKEAEPEKFEGNAFADWCMNPERKDESAAAMLARAYVKDNGAQSVAEMRKRLDFSLQSIREKIAAVAHKKGLTVIELQDKLTEQGIDAEDIDAILAIYDSQEVRA